MKNIMKCNPFLLSLMICVLGLFIAAGCTRNTDDRHYLICFKNNTETALWVFFKDEYPDTSLIKIMRNPRVDNTNAILPGDNSTGGLYSSHPIENMFGFIVFADGDTVGFDTLMVYVINNDTLDRYGWQNVKENYLVQQRYDLSLADLKRLNWQLYFPPKESMRDIKMWPPYGTYDANGHRIEQ